MMKQWPIRTRILALGIVPLVLLFVSLLGGYLYSRLEELDAQLRTRGEFMAKQLAPACEYGVISGNTGMLRSLLNSAIKEPGVVFIEVRNQDDRPLLKVDRPTTSDAEFNLTLFQADIVVQDLPIDNLDSGAAAKSQQPKRVGMIVVGLSDEPNKRQQAQILALGTVLALLALGLTTVWAILVARGLSNPIIQLSQMVTALKNGDFRTRVVPEPHGEIGALQNNLNALATSLETANAAERMYADNLIKARESADAANRAKSDFLAKMSHELRTPMNGTLGMLQLLQETELSEQQDGYVRTAVDATEHLLTVINDILDFSKIDEGKLQLEQVYFDLHELITRVVNSFQKEATSRNLVLRAEYVNAPGPHEVLGDPTRVRQILINLISNALKFTEEGSVTVRCEWRLLTDETLEVILSVIDTGVGISEERQATVFLPFTQGESVMARRQGGTGLGLAISRQLAVLMQGLLTVSSKPGFGSRFDLRLPMPFRRLAHRVSVPFTQQVLQRLNGHVLLVEDNMVNQLVVQGFLTKMGLTVELASDGKQAVEFFQSKAYDLVIMDCQMPIMDGYEASGEIRRLERNGGRRIPIIALTAHAMQGDRERCLAAGMDDYLSKPVKKEDLHATLQRWLKPEAQR